MSELRPPGMRDVAQLAGVSHQTVSRVLNQSPSVRPETAQRVRAAIDATGYRPNRAARALATQRSGLIGVLASGFPHFGPATTVSAIETAARLAGFSAVVSVHADPSREEVIESLQPIFEHGVQGVIVVTPRLHTAEAALDCAQSTPVVLVADLPYLTGAAHQVSVDQRGGAAWATQHLIDRGARTIAHVSGPVGWFDADRRVQGWEFALRAAGLTVPPILVGDWSADTAYELGRTMLASGPLPDAAFCANDLTALGLLAALREAGVRCPEDIQVIGFDDLPSTAFLDPPLTTVRQPLEELGKRALSVLLDAVAGSAPKRHTLEPTPVIRGTTR